MHLGQAGRRMIGRSSAFAANERDRDYEVDNPPDPLVLPLPSRDRSGERARRAWQLNAAAADDAMFETRAFDECLLRQDRECMAMHSASQTK